MEYAVFYLDFIMYLKIFISSLLMFIYCNQACPVSILHAIISDIVAP